MGFSNERMRTGQLVNWFLLDGLELTPAGYPVTQALSLPFGVDHLIGFNELLVYGKVPQEMAAMLREHNVAWQAFPHSMAARVRAREEAQ